MGSGYVIEHCIATINTQRQRECYEMYMADAAYAIMRCMLSKDVEIKRYYDIVHPPKEDKRSGEEIAADIISRHKLKAVG